MSDAEGRTQLFGGLARTRFGLGMGDSGMSAVWKEAFNGRNFSPRYGGARLYIMNGMTREATQELGGWKSPAVMENLYNKTRSEEVAPEMRAAVSAACAILACAIRT